LVYTFSLTNVINSSHRVGAKCAVTDERIAVRTIFRRADSVMHTKFWLAV